MPVAVDDGTTILEAAKTVGIMIPHLCYLKGINNIGACRICSVEVEGELSLVPSCNTVVREGMKVTTNSALVRSACRTNLMLIMSQHEGRCSLCDRSGTCQLQKLTNDYDFFENLYVTDLPEERDRMWVKDFPLFRDPAKCIKCMRCIQVCDKMQSVHIWDVAGTGSRTTIDVSNNRVIKDSDCVLCGQCITHCPVAGLRERDDTENVYDAIADPEKVVICQVAPAVRTAWCEQFGLSRQQGTINRMAAALRRLGFDHVYDTTFSADLTIMEEASELIHRFTTGGLDRYPMFTSCCPGWVRFIKGQYPELTGQLSTSKSPQQMFGAIAKTWLAQKLGVAPEKLFLVSIMPCLAKKAECALPTMRTEHGPDVDVVLTTRELIRMLRADAINPKDLPEEPLDSPMGAYTGAGSIFGTTGGVMEAALRSAYAFLTGTNPDPDMFSAIRLGPGLREATYEIKGIKVRCAAVSGLANTRELLEALKRKEKAYDFVEVMACPGGCAGGGGQPIHKEDGELAATRSEELRFLDENNPMRFSHENPEIQQLYSEFLGKPLSELAEKLLHTDHFGWKM